MNKNTDLPKGQNGKSSKKRYSLHLALEPRYLFDATIAGAQQLVEQLTAPQQGAAPHTDATSVSAESLGAANRDTPTAHIEPPALSDFNAYKSMSERDKSVIQPSKDALDLEAKAGNLVDVAPPESPTELMFVDSKVQNFEQLLANGTRSNVEVHVLDGDKDGFSQISEVLANHKNVSAIHVVTHGSTDHDSISLGNEAISEQTLKDHSGEISNWKSSLSSNADLLIYSDVGNSISKDLGAQSLMKELSSLSGTDVGILHLDLSEANQQDSHSFEQVYNEHVVNDPELSKLNLDHYDKTQFTLNIRSDFVLVEGEIEAQNPFQSLHNEADASHSVATDTTNTENIALNTLDPSKAPTDYLSNGIEAYDAWLAGLGYTTDHSGMTTVMNDGHVVTVETIDGITFYDPTIAKAEGTATSTTIYTATDQNALTVTYGIRNVDGSTGGDAAAFTVVNSSGAVKFAAIPDYETKNTYTVYIYGFNSSGGTRSIEQLIVNINDVAPTITSGTTANIAEGTTSAVYTTVASDTAGGTLTYSLSGTDAALFNISSLGVVTFISAPNFETPLDSGGNNVYNFTVNVGTVNGLLTATKNVAITVTNVLPTMTSSATGSIAEGNTVAYTAVASDPGGGPLTYSLVTVAGEDTSKFTINSSTGVVSFITAPNFEAPNDVGGTNNDNIYRFTVRANDGTGNSSNLQVNVTVTNVAPSFSSTGTGSTAEGTTTTGYQANASDPGGGPATVYSISGGVDAAKFSINSGTGVLSFVAAPNYESPTDTGANNVYDVIIQAVTQGGTITQAVAVSVTDIAPVISSGTAISVAEGNTSTGYTAAATDVGGGTPTYTISGGADAAKFTINSSTGALSFVSAPNFEAPTDVGGDNVYNVDISAGTVGGTATSIRSVAVTVTDVAPVIPATASVTVPEGTLTSAIIYTAVANDPAGGSVSYSLQGTDAAAFTINASTGAVKFVTSPDFETKTSYSFSVKASDPNGLFNLQAVTVNVSDVAPIIAPTASVTVPEGTLTSAIIYTASATDPGDAGASSVTYSLQGTDAAAFTINATTGAVKFVTSPDFETKTSYSFSVKASDPNGLFNLQAVTVNVSDVAPTIAPTASVTVPEGTLTSSIIYTASATDPGDAGASAVIYTLQGTDAAAFTINASTGAVKFVTSPDFETKTSYSFSVKAADPNGLFNLQAVTVNVSDVAPIIAPTATVTVPEGTLTSSIIHTAVATDPGDAGASAVTYSLEGTDAAAFTINATTGAVKFVTSPDFETKTSYSFSVKASDPNGLFNLQAVTVNVSDVAPVIAPTASVTIPEGTLTSAIIYTASATDPGDAGASSVTYSLQGTDAAAFTINATTGAVKFITSPDFETKTSYSFSVKAADPNGLFNLQAVTVNVSDAAPIIAPTASVTVPEGTLTSAIIHTAVATDPGDAGASAVTYSLQGTDAAAFTINATTGEVKFVTSPDFETKASYSFSVKASDPNGLFNLQAVTVNVSDVAPIIAPTASVTVPEGTLTSAIIHTAAATDPGDAGASAVTYSLQGTDAAAFTINATTGAVKFVTSPDFETKTSYSFTIKAADPNGLFNLQAVTVNVSDVAPVIAPTASVTVPEGTLTSAIIHTAAATDPGDAGVSAVTYSLQGTDAAAFTINATTGEIKFVTSPDFETKTSYSFSVKAADPNGLFNLQAVTVNVSDVAPIIAPTASVTVPEGTLTSSIIYTASATDPGDAGASTVIYSLEGTDAAAFTINASTGAVKFVTSPDFETKTSYSFTIKAADPNGLFNLQAVTVNVSDVAPIIAPTATVTVPEGTLTSSIIHTAVATDPGDAGASAVTYTLQGTDAAAFTINATTGEIKFVTSPDFETKTSYSFSVKAADPNGLFNLQAVTVNVSDVAPIIAPTATVTVPEGTLTSSIIHTAVATDPGDAGSSSVTYSLQGTDAAAFTINATTGAVKFVTSPDFETKTSYSFSVKAADPNGLFNLQAVTVNVSDVAPIIAPTATITVPEGTLTSAIIHTASATDPGDAGASTVIYSLEGTDAAAFNINASTGEIRFNNVPDFESKTSYSFSVKAADPNGLFNLQAVTVNVSNVAPVIDPTATITVPEGTLTSSIIHTAMATDPGDAGASSIIYSLEGTDAAAFNINASTGEIRFNNVPDFESKTSYSFSVKAAHTNGLFNMQALTVNVSDVAPSIAPTATVTVPEGRLTSSIIHTAMATDPGDAGASSVIYSLEGTDAAAFSIDASTGEIRFNNIPDFESKTSYTFKVKAADPNGLFNLQAVTVNVSDVAPNIAPTATVTVPEGTLTSSIIHTAVATDPGDAGASSVTYSLQGTDAAAFSINASTGEVKFVTSPDFETKSSYSFSVKAADPNGLFNLQAVTVNVSDVAPIIAPTATVTVPEGTLTSSIIHTAMATDPGDAGASSVTYSLQGTDAAAFSINASTGEVKFVTSPDFETKSSYSFSVKAADPNGLFNLQAVTVNVSDVAPIIAPTATVTVPEGTLTSAIIYTASATDPGDAGASTVIYSLEGTDAAAFSINASTGEIRFNNIPDFETKSSYSFGVKAADPNGLFNLQAVTVNVSDVAPIIAPTATVTVPEGTLTSSIIHTAMATDPGDAGASSVIYSLEGTDAAAFSIDASTGEIRFNNIPDFESKASYSFNVKAADPNGLFNLQAVTVNVSDVAPNIAPTATITVPEGTLTSSIIHTAIATDPGDAGASSVIYSLEGTDAAAFSIDASTGEIRFNNIPDFESKTSYNFNVKAADPNGLFNLQAVTVNVSDVAPIIAPTATVTVPEGTLTSSIIHTAVATDPGDAGASTVIYSLEGTDTAAFSIDASTGEIRFNNIPDFESKASYSFNVKAADPNGLFNLQAVTVNVSDVAPSIAPTATITVPEGTLTSTIIHTAIATDPGDAGASTVIYSLEGTDAAAFSIDASTGEIRFNNIPDFESKNSYSFGVKAADPNGLFNLQEVTVNVSNLAPDIVPTATITVPEGTLTSSIIHTALAIDPGDVIGASSVTYSLEGTDAAAFSIDASTGEVRFNNIPNFETKTSYSFNVKAVDPSGLFNLQAVTVNVSNVAPVIDPTATITVPEGTLPSSVIFTAVANDAGDVNGASSVIYSLEGKDASAFSIDASTGELRFIGIPDFESKTDYSFNIKASDPSGLASVQAMTVIVSDVAPNIAPTATITVPEGTLTSSIIHTAVATDPGDAGASTVIYSLEGTDAAAFSIDASTGEIRFNNIPDFESKASYSFNVKAADPNGLFNMQAVTVNVSDVAPSIAPTATITVPEGTLTSTIIHTAIATDPGDAGASTVIYSLEGTDAAAFSIDASTGEIRFNNIPDFESKNSYSFGVKAADPNGLFNLQEVTVNVSNLAPDIVPTATITVPEGTLTSSIIHTASAIDPGDVIGASSVTYSLEGTDAAAFSIDASTGEVRFNNMPDFESKTSYSFNVKAVDPSGLFNLQAVTVNVSNVAPDIAPTAAVTVPEGTSTSSVIHTAAAGDAGDTGTSSVTYTLEGADASAFNINASTGEVRLNSVPDFESKANHHFNVRASDPSGLSTIQAVTVNIANLAPSITSSDSASVPEGTSISTVVYNAFGSDPGGGTVTYALSGADASAFTIDQNSGAVKFISVPDFATKSVYNFDVQAIDPGGASQTKAVALNVTPVEKPIDTDIARASPSIALMQNYLGTATVEGGVVKGQIAAEGPVAIVNAGEAVNVINVVARGVQYSIATVQGEHGTLQVNTTTGEYSYVPREVSEASVKTTLREQFVLTIPGGESGAKNIVLTINIKVDQNNQPEVKAMLSEMNLKTPSGMMAITKAITGETVVGTAHFQTEKSSEKQATAAAQPAQQAGTGNFDAHMADLLNDFGLDK